MSLQRLAVIALLAIAGGCASSVTADTDAAPPIDAAEPLPPGMVRVRGRVWAPGQAIGVVPAGEEIPVAAATIYLSAERPPGIPQRAHCQRCTSVPSSAVLSGHDGSFTLDAAPGNYWLVIEKGQFRRERQVFLDADAVIDVPSLDSTLPSYSDPEAGYWIPRIAVAVGDYDHIEDLLGKLGLGAVGPNGRLSSTADEIAVYGNDHIEVPMVGRVGDLLRSIDAMRRYHVILLPCSTMRIAELDDEAVLRNIRRFVNEGGKIYVTDASVGVADRAFPTQLQIGGNSPSMGPVDSIGTYDPVTLEGELTQVGQRFSVYYDSDDTEIVDPLMSRWLGQQRGPSPESDTATQFAPASFTTYGNFNWIEAVHPVRLGVTADGAEVIDTPKIWAIGSGPQPGDGAKRPLTVSFEPTGCGRVMYSTYHTTGPLEGHRGLFAQERIMLYLVLELGTCSPLPEIDQ